MARSEHVAVVGGGLTGLLAAALLAGQGREVTIIESSEHLGGLLSSAPGPEGAWFDLGTHVPQETGVPAVDQILFSRMDREPWRDLGPLRAGNVFKGALDEATPFPDLNRLGADLHATAVSEILRVRSHTPEPASCREALLHTFGPTTTQEVFEPLLRKLLGRDADQLAPGAFRLFLSRVVALDPATTRELKRLPHLDPILAFHSGAEGASQRRAWYPGTGGAGRWIADLVEQWLQGVDVRLSMTIDDVRLKGTRAEQLLLSSGEALDIGEIVWTTPAIEFARAAGLSMPSDLQRPTLRCTELHHVVFDAELDTDAHYLTVLDEDLVLFRATIYQTLREDGPPSCTLEVMSEAPSGDVSAQLDRLVAELRDVGIVRGTTKVRSSTYDVVHNGFPVMTSTFVESSHVIAELCRQSTSNLRLLGRSTGRAFFMSDVLRDCWEQLA